MSERLYYAALRKLALWEKPTPAEARELRRRRLADGSYPAPRGIDAQIPKVPVLPLKDPRT